MKSLVVKNTEFTTDHHLSTLVKSSMIGSYVHHQVSSTCKIIITGRDGADYEFDVEFQTGVDTYQNDQCSPTNCLVISGDGGTDRFIINIIDLDTDSLDDYAFQELKDECSAIESIDDIKMIKSAIGALDNSTPDFHKMFDLPDDIKDYEVDGYYDGTVWRKKVA